MSWIKGFESFVRADEPLAQHTWLRVGGKADFFAEPRTVDELAQLLRRAHENGLPVRLLGGGSNVLVTESGVRGVVIRLSDPSFAKIEVRGTRVTTGGGAQLGHVINTSVREGLGGLETLVGIPGTVGGALHSNAGSRSGDIGQWVIRATVMNRSGEISQRVDKEMVFAYRQSSLDDLAILEAELQLEQDSPAELTKRMQKQWIVTKAAQPMAGLPTGSVFKNPRGMSAGTLIDQLGLKGTRVGGAEVSDRHANFIITDKDATASDVLRLIELVRSRVADRLGIELELQLEVWK